jgi:hypothetical protein
MGRIVTIWPRFARAIPARRHLHASSNCRPSGSAFGACCCAGKLRSPAPLTRRATSPGPARVLRGVRQTLRWALRQTLRWTLRAPGAYPYSAGLAASPLVASPAGGQSPAKTAGDWPPAGERKLALAMRQPDPAVRKPPSAAIDPFSRPAAAWRARNLTAHLRCAAAFGGDPFQPCHGQERTNRHTRLVPLVTIHASLVMLALLWRTVAQHRTVTVLR